MVKLEDEEEEENHTQIKKNTKKFDRPESILPSEEEEKERVTELLKTVAQEREVMAQLVRVAKFTPKEEEDEGEDEDEEEDEDDEEDEE
ncbi:hypothetical protein LTR94_033608, partial [Friedmanniomyces endolithicus]